MIVVKASRWYLHILECNLLLIRKGCSEGENPLSSRRSRLEEKNHLHSTHPVWQIILILSPPLDFLGSQICHAVSFEWNLLHDSAAQGRLAAPGTDHPWWLRKGNAHSCCGKWTDAGVGLGKGSVAGHIKRAAALNAQRVSTRSICNVELVEKPVNGITYITQSISLPLPKPPSLHEKKLAFSLFHRGPECLHA